MEVVGKKKEGLYRFPEMIIVPSEKRSIRTHQDKYYRPLSYHSNLSPQAL